MSRDITALPPVAATERVGYGTEPSQFFDLFRPQNEVRGAAMMVHGGFWRARYDLLHASHLCAALAREGIATANLEYRRVGESGGGWPGTYDDVVAGFDAVGEMLGERVVVLGHSAGGHLALRLAVDRKPAGVIALAPAADLRRAYELNLSNGAVAEFLGGTPEEVPENYEAADPMRHGSAVRRILIHGVADDTVPLEISRNFTEARRGDKPEVELVTIEGANHFDLIDPESAAWETVRDNVKALLGVARGA